MSKIALTPNASGTGTFTIAAPNSNTNRTLTLQDVSGEVLTTGSTFAGTGPAFSAYMGANQTVTHITFTKLQMNTEVFDTNSNYDPTTNFRFTPTVAGYYHIIASASLGSANPAHRIITAIYKNGASYKTGSTGAASGVAFPGSEVSSILYMNGSTDFLEAYVYIDVGSGTNTIYSNGEASRSQFSGVLVRAA
jgi:hypothetical protein